MVTRKVTVKDPLDRAAMSRFLGDIGKRYGEVTQSGDDIPYLPPIISSGSMEVDYALGCGGWPQTRCVELWGTPGSCKTTLSLMAIAEAQKAHPDKFVAFLDVEHSFDRSWAEAHGVNVDQLQLIGKEVKYSEDWFDILGDVAASPLFSMTVMDSIGALISREESEKHADQAVVGTLAKQITRAVREIAPAIRASGQLMMFINQVRAIVGPMGGTTTGGGFGLKHVSSIQAKHAESGTGREVTLNGEKIKVGKEISVRTKKNKLAPPEQVARPTLYQMPTEKYGPVGLDRAAEAFAMGKLTRVLTKTGKFYVMPATGEELPSEDKVIEHLRHAPEDIAAIRTGVLALRADKVTPDLVTPGDAPEDFDPDQAAAETVAEMEGAA